MTKEELASEIWKGIPNFSLYEVSDLGRVRSLSHSYKRKEWRGKTVQTVFWKGRLLKGWIKYDNGKPTTSLVTLRRDGKTYYCRVSRLVLFAFVGKPPLNTESCHHDGDHSNNRLTNLRWDTRKNNQLDSIRHGTKTNPPVLFGENHPNSSLTDAQIREIRATKPIVRGTKARLARLYNVSNTSIGRILGMKTRVTA